MGDAGRFTWQGPEAVERRIERDQQRVKQAISGLVDPANLRTLVLAGGYGRGEGGFRWRGGVPAPFNDYDYFIVVGNLGRPAMRRLRRSLQALGHRLSSELGLEVDFAALEERRLHRLPVCTMYSELKWAHRALLGDPRCLQAIPGPDPSELPLAEATRTLLNRGALLLMNEIDLRRDAPAGTERFERYLCKAILASGEALLAKDGRYHPLLAVRQARLAERDTSLPPGFLSLHQGAMDYKFGSRDTAVALDTPLARQRAAVAAWSGALAALESRRLGTRVGDWTSHALASVPKGQGKAGVAGMLRHIALHVASPRRRRWLREPLRCVHHPRERLIAALPLLLETQSDAAPVPAARALGVADYAGWNAVAEAFLEAWPRYC
jgi:hypothetical protein